MIYVVAAPDDGNLYPLVVGLTPPELRLFRLIVKPVDRFMDHVRYVRREKVAPPEAKAQGAPGNAKWDPKTRSIVLYDKGVYHDGKLDPVQFGRSIYHELAHAILHAAPGLLARWTRATAGDGYVDEYAKTSPEEDFADSFSESLLFPREVQKRALRKFVFVIDLLNEVPREKVAMNHMLIGFAEELTKVGFKIPSGLGRILPKIGLGLAGAGAVGVGAEQLGEHKGEKEGFNEGVHEMQGGMRQAYVAGVQRGAMSMRDAILQQMKTRGAGGE